MVKSSLTNPKEENNMPLIEGGAFKCYIHKFTTKDLGEWDKHCINTKHTISGETRCIDCGDKVHFDNEPFRGTGKFPIVFCDKCKENRK